MFTAALAFLATPLGKRLLEVLAALALIAGVVGYIYHAGVSHETKAVGRRDAAATLVIQKHEAVAGQISVQAASDTSAAREKVRTVTRTLIEKVPQYVPADADRDCVVPRGWVRLHDAAAAGLSSPSGGPDEAASGVPLSAVAATVVSNYGVAYDWRAEALGWRSWYVTQKAAWDRKP